MYVPFSQLPLSAGTFVIAGDLDPAATTAALRIIVQQIDPAIPFDRVQTLSDLVDESLSQPRFYSVMVGVFGALALLLAVSGLYAVIAFTARRRMFEFGVRSALGARPVDNLWLVYRQGLLLSLGGVGAGLVIAIQATSVLRTLLYRTEPADPATLAIAAGATLVIALAAVMTPALQAARADPVAALRAE
jgi:putative ABC transport system permease protein